MPFVITRSQPNLWHIKKYVLVTRSVELRSGCIVGSRIALQTAPEITNWIFLLPSLCIEILTAFQNQSLTEEVTTVLFCFNKAIRYNWQSNKCVVVACDRRYWKGVSWRASVNATAIDTSTLYCRTFEASFQTPPFTHVIQTGVGAGGLMPSTVCQRNAYAITSRRLGSFRERQSL